ncbi:MtaA/CmuA family methyltransferase [Dehalobacterium formicoaceticum]|uniref:MtaA/CmuA family methyltransferase n=1 Tax=Dehalobacterium formicoaceticum TaxID=51515 RepID=A0ABT1Y2N7_9FIRM|nr:MtaA/CmuA family methyltransferase [Dehalobacterium formicoaceticum]MCR6545133.1 MtaA/CmuA family methyltransferase [Dehalobacterium formicoaceticum]
MNKKERFMNALLGKETDRASVFCANQTATYEQMEKLGAYWPEAHFDADVMASLAVGAYQILDFDAVRVPFCQTIESEAMGCTLKDGGKTGVPSIDAHPYQVNDTPPSLDNFVEKGRIRTVAKALKSLKEKVGDEVAVLGGVVGPFSVATNLLGLMNIMMAAVMEPEKLEPWLKVAKSASEIYGKELIAAGADGIVIEDMMSSMDMISPQIYHDISNPHLKNLVDSLGGIPTILHICGKINPLVEDMITSGVSAFSVDTKVDIKDIKEKIAKSGRTVTVVGGIDAVNTLFYGKETEPVKEEAKKSLEAGYDLLAPSCSIPPATPTDKLLAMVEVAADFKRG